MKVIQNRNAEKLTLSVEGRLDTTTAQDFETAAFNSVIGVKELTVDMEKLEYVSSAGLRVILKLQKHMAKAGSMKLVKVNESVMEVFQITGFADILDIE